MLAFMHAHKHMRAYTHTHTHIHAHTHTVARAHAHTHTHTHTHRGWENPQTPQGDMKQSRQVFRYTYKQAYMSRSNNNHYSRNYNALQFTWMHKSPTGND